jgi:hypothetical protein
MTADPKRNPGWKRPPGWVYEEDWGSPAWIERMRIANEERQRRLLRYGFHDCPACGVQHGPGMTLTCRVCGHKAVDPDAGASA